MAHKITAVASLQGPARASAFLSKIDGPSSAATYGTYAELVADPDVDIIYVATPHSHHFQNAMLALEAGKNVLCEKALTVTEAQAQKLVAKAREKKLFFMEAVWTRFFPWSIKIRELVKSGEIGTVHRVIGALYPTPFHHPVALSTTNTKQPISPSPRKRPTARSPSPTTTAWSTPTSPAAPSSTSASTP